MHGVIHRTLKTYVTDRAGEDGWNTVLDRTGIEPTLYLQVSHYPDQEVAAILETVATLSGNEVTAVERDFGRVLATELVGTFRAHLGADPDLFEVLDRLDEIYETLRSNDDEIDPPSIECEPIEREPSEPELVEAPRAWTPRRITYRSHRDHPGVAYGILEGLVQEFEADATVRPVSSLERGSDTYAFDVVPGS